MLNTLLILSHSGRYLRCCKEERVADIHPHGGQQLIVFVVFALVIVLFESVLTFTYVLCLYLYLYLHSYLYLLHDN